MQLIPKTRGQVSWSGNPLDEEASAPESQRRMSTPGRHGAMPLPPDPAASGSDFMPYSEHELSDDARFLRPSERTIRISGGSAVARRHHQVTCQAGSGSVGRTDPQALRSAWAHWFEAHPAPHGHARAAASFRVKEAELLRALLLGGHGVHALHNDLAGLLAPAAHWGRILVEVHHPLGFAYLGLSPRQVRNDGGQVVVLEADRQLLLAGNAFAECFLVHGAGACGIHGFDEHGEPIARLHLTSNSTGATADFQGMPHLLAHVLPPGQMPVPDSHAANRRLTRPGWCAIERQIHAPEALAELCRRLNLTLEEAPAMQFAVESEGVILACQATPLHKAGATATVPHGLRDCKVYLRCAAVRHATVCTGSDGRPFVRLHAMDGSCLRFQHAGSPVHAHGWVDSLLRRNA